jgi:hypothetical protein
VQPAVPRPIHPDATSGCGSLDTKRKYQWRLNTDNGPSRCIAVCHGWQSWLCDVAGRVTLTAAGMGPFESPIGICSPLEPMPARVVYGIYYAPVSPLLYTNILGVVGGGTQTFRPRTICGRSNITVVVLAACMGMAWKPPTCDAAQLGKPSLNRLRTPNRLPIASHRVRACGGI